MNFELNFWIMDVSASAMILLSGFYGRRLTESKKSENKVLRIPDVFFLSESSGATTDSRIFDENREKDQSRTENLRPYPRLTFFLYIIIYFALMAYSVILATERPILMRITQHVAVLSFIYFTSTYFFTKPKGQLVFFIISTIWLLSAKTSFRWIINNVIILACTIMASHVQFRNFTYLQIFIWTAFVYDALFLLDATGPYLTSLFSIDSGCSRLCLFLSDTNNFDLPTMFSIRLGNEREHVFIGTGDILIGALLTNFSATFFRSRGHVVGVAASFGVSIAVLYRVGDKPFPALCSIVPICSCALILCSLFTNRLRELLLDQDRYTEPPGNKLSI